MSNSIANLIYIYIYYISARPVPVGETSKDSKNWESKTQFHQQSGSNNPPRSTKFPRLLPQNSSQDFLYHPPPCHPTPLHQSLSCHSYKSWLLITNVFTLRGWETLSWLARGHRCLCFLTHIILFLFQVVQNNLFNYYCYSGPFPVLVAIPTHHFYYLVILFSKIFLYPADESAHCLSVCVPIPLTHFSQHDNCSF